MASLDLQGAHHIHLVGVGGAGLSAIARILLQRGLYVSGSDRAANAFTTQLAEAGAHIFIGHRAEQIAGADVLIVSSAINPQNPEIAAALAHAIPIYKRSEMLSALMVGQHCLAISGTHGKTTTTAMVVHILRTLGHDPSYIVGGLLENTGDNAHHGSGDAFVIEADEYDNAFHGLLPEVALVTSLEYDHPDFFPTMTAMVDSFAAFVQLLPPDGRLIVCADNAAHTLADGWHSQVRTYGQHRGDFRIHDVRYTDDTMQFEVSEWGRVLATAHLSVYGVHNALNGLGAALVASTQAQVSLEAALTALTTFRGTGRRFEVRADLHNVVVIDDYAHHPTAIATTLDAARQRYPAHTLWAVWQPHTFSRTAQLLDDYAASFADAQHVLITDIFASREAFTDVVHSRDVLAEMAHPSARYSGTLEATAQLLIAEVTAPAVVLIMSAGDAPTIGAQLIAHLETLT